MERVRSIRAHACISIRPGAAVWVYLPLRLLVGEERLQGGGGTTARIFVLTLT